MNIYESITNAMADIEPIAKGRRNEKQGFNFRGIDEIMNELQPVLKKHGLFVVPCVKEVQRQEIQSKSGGTLLYSVVTMEYTMYANDGTYVKGATVGEGMDSGDKASNKAMAVALKYFLLQTFCIPTEDTKDPDGESHEVAPKADTPEYITLKTSLIDWLAVEPKLLTDAQRTWVEARITAKDTQNMKLAIDKFKAASAEARK